MKSVKVADSDFATIVNGHGIGYKPRTASQHSQRAKGLGWFVTGLFVVGDLAGGGLVALPMAMIQAGIVSGVIINILMALLKAYTAYLLGRCWTILRDNWPDEYANVHCRKPYPEMAYRALGRRMRTFVSVCIDITQFGISVVFLLLSAKNISDFLKAFFDIHVSFCLIILVLAIVLLPLTFLKSPQDFWGAVVCAMFTTGAAVVLIVVGAALDYEVCAHESKPAELKFGNFFLAFGTLLFAYGGHACIPTIQHDMKKPYEFTKSSILAFSIMACMYIPVCIMCYFTYGDSIRDSTINSLQIIWIQQAVNVFITIHCILTLTIVFNPIMQEAEEIFHVPQHFCLKRVIVRSCVMGAIVLVAETFPTFGPLLDLFGGSTMTLTSLVFPCLFFLCLSQIDKDGPAVSTINISDGIVATKQPQRGRLPLLEVLKRTDRFTLCLTSVIIVVGVIGGCAITVSAIREISYAKFIPPCYYSMIFPVDSGDNTVFGNTHCCGVKQDVSRYTNFCRMMLFKAILLLMIVGLAFGDISGPRIKKSYYYNNGYGNEGSCCGNAGPYPQQLMSSKRTVSSTQQQGGLLGAILGAPITSVSDTFPA